MCYVLQPLQAARVPAPPPDDDDDDDGHYEERINSVADHVMCGDVVLHDDFWVAF